MAEKVEIKISVDKKTGAIKVAGQELQSFGDKAQVAAAKTKAATSSLGGLTSAFGGLIAGASVVQFFRASTNAAIEQEDAVNKLNTALKIQGNFTQAASRELQEYASQLQATTRFGDETILGTQALLASFGIQGEELKKTTQATLDLATATGTDLNAAALLLAKAFKGETGSLSRYGIILDESTPKSEKFAAAVAEINKNFGGSAQADVKTFGGGLQQLKNQLGDIQEEIGIGLIPALRNIGSGTQDSLPFLTNFGLALSGIVGTAITGIKSVVDILAGAVDTAVTLVVGAADNIRLTISGLIDIIRALLSGNFDAAKAGVADLVRSVGESAQKTRADVGEAIGGIVEDSRKNNKALEETWAATFGRIAGARQEAATAANDAENQASENAKEKARERSEEEKRLALAYIELEQGKFAAARVAAEEEIAELQAKGQEKFTVLQEGVEREINLEMLKRLRLKKIDEEEAKFKAEAQKKLDAERKKTEEKALKRADEGFKATASLLDNIVELSGSKNKELNQVQKGFQIASAIRDTFVGANKALAQGGFFGFVMAASVVSAGLANVARIRAMKEGGRVGKPTLGLIGEGGEPETVVPDSKAEGFALGVLAGKGKGGAVGSEAGVGAPVNITFEGGINITIEATDLTDPERIREIATGLAEEVRSETEKGITLSRLLGDLAKANVNRAV